MKINQRLTLCFSLLFCLLSISYASAQQLNISGVVISSEDNEPLIGATVSVKGNPTKGVITDINGQFQLSVETGTKMLVVSYVGMKTQEIRVPRKEKELKIVLIPETMDIDEVVVTGYGNFSKSSFTGSANTLRTDMLKEVPVMSVEQKLQGMTTGVQITSSSGQPGANQSIRIRGMGSFNASQEPLFVIDGVPVTSGSMSSGGPDAAYMNNSKTNIMSTLNPLRDILTDYNRVRMTRMFSTGYAAIEPIKGLKLKETLSYDYTIQKDSRYYNPLSSAGPKSGSDAQTAKGFIEYGKLISSTSLNYVRTFARKHHLDVLAAYEIESYQTDHASGEKSKLPSDKLTEPDNAAVLNSFKSATQAYRMISYLSRLNYDYDDRYYIAGSYRRDGSSRLSPNNRWGNFWSVSGMWHLGNENFMKAVKPVLSDIKIRASYGVNGNQPGSYYGYKGLYSYGENYMEAAGSYESAQPNDLLTWEKNYSLNLGIDLSFINRIFASLEYYNRDTKDLLYSLPISATTGFTSYLSNIGRLNNKGVEFELRTLNVVSNDFNWTSVFNLSHNRNKIVSLNGLLDQTIEGTWFIHKVGLPYHTFYVKEFAGVDPLTGSAQYYLNTKNEDGSYNRELTTDAAKAESIPYKTATPKVSGGFTNILNYKWIDLTFTLTYSLGGYSFDKLGTYIENGSSSIYSSRYNLPAYMMNRWQKPGDQTDIPRFVYGEPATSTNSSRYIHSTDHLRLKNFTLGFTLPNQWTQKLMIDKVRVYFSGNNLLTWAKWKQYDPETPVNGEVFCEAPAMRTFSFGAQLSF